VAYHPGVTVRVRARPGPPVWLEAPEPGRATALLGGGLAALVAGLGMLVLRSGLEVRSIPERLMEWLLLFVPLDVFEMLLQRFGFDAKRYALEVAVVVMLAALGAIGYAVLRSGLRTVWLPLVGLGFWLVVMLVIMPLTAAGVFAMNLEDGKRGVIGGYLAIGLSYAGVLAAARAWGGLLLRHLDKLASGWMRSRPGWASGGPDQPATVLDRRVAMGLIGTSVLAYASTYVAALLFPKQNAAPSVLVLDPQEPVPSGGLEPPNPHPQMLATPVAGTAPTQPTLPAATATAAAALPEPPPARQLERDKDGAVVRSGRQPGQLAEPITSNTDFYIVTKNAGGDPVVHPQDWRLLVDGEVQRTFQLDYTTLRKLPAVEVTKTLECISNFVGKPELAPFGAELISTATWKGVRVSDILQLTGGPKAGADWLAVLAADEYTSAVPMEAALDPSTLLVYEMNGAPLPREHGYPARLLVPGRYGMKNAKWVIGLRPMRREFLDWYGQRNWSKTAIIRTMCRIDTPEPGATLGAGTQTIAGVAYAGTRGIRRVEYSADGGQSWQMAQLGESVAGQDRWISWRGQFTLAPGAELTLVARATDGTGALQDQPFTLPEPDGGTGWPHLTVHTA